MLGTVVSGLGICLTGIGTFVRVAPDLERRTRRHFYSIAPFTRGLFSLRNHVKKRDEGYRFTIEHRQVCKEFIDYVDAHDIREPPDEVPKSVTNGAAALEIELPNGDTENYLQGNPSQRSIVELLTLSIERACRNYGLLIAVIGAVITVVGTAI
jgi:hypothetical protein